LECILFFGFRSIILRVTIVFLERVRMISPFTRRSGLLLSVFLVSICLSLPLKSDTLSKSKPAIPNAEQHDVAMELDVIKKAGLQGKSVRNPALQKAIIVTLSEKNGGTLPRNPSIYLTKWKGGGRYLCHCFTNAQGCNDTAVIANSALLAIVKIDSSTGAVHTIAILADPFAGAVPPSDGVADDTRDIDLCDPITCYDFAPFIIAPGDTAFGIRSEHVVTYAGGFSRSEMLYLFHSNGDKIVLIASIAVCHEQNLAGEWHSDGTRDHEIDETKYIIQIGEKGIDGYNNLIVKETTGSKSETRLRWDVTTQSYR
jgi:hypothetical protein